MAYLNSRAIVFISLFIISACVNPEEKSKLMIKNSEGQMVPFESVGQLVGSQANQNSQAYRVAYDIAKKSEFFLYQAKSYRALYEALKVEGFSSKEAFRLLEARILSGDAANEISK